jgi:hypothetical protein
LTLIVVPLFAIGASFQSPEAMKGSVVDSHEGMTISAEPWTAAEQYKSAFHKKSPLTAGIVAVQVVLRNSTNESIRVGLDSVRLTISLDENNRQDLHPLSAEEVADIVLRPGAKDPTSRSRLPLPIPSSSGGRNKKWTELKNEAEDAGVRDGVVAPHKTVEGLLYFDLRGQFDLLSAAHLYIPNLVMLESNHSLLFFDLDLSHSAQR